MNRSARWSVAITFGNLFLVQALLSQTTVDAVEQVRFHYRSLPEGGTAEQSVSSSIELQMTVHQKAKILDRFQQNIHRSRNRTVKVLKTVQHRATKVEVRYGLDSQSTVIRNKPYPPTSSPVSKKSYIVLRDGKKLIVTDVKGQETSPEERAIVAQNMEMLGQPNPLAEFLDGRTLTVGKTVEVPKHLVRELFGFQNELEKAERFDIMLAEIFRQAGKPCCKLKFKIDARYGEQQKVALSVTGTMIIQKDDCRVLEMNLEGPMTITGRADDEKQFTGSGRFAQHVKTVYK